MSPSAEDTFMDTWQAKCKLYVLLNWKNILSFWALQISTKYILKSFSNIKFLYTSFIQN